jgi:Bacterial TSP3 repeat
MISTHMISSPSRRLSIARRGAAVLALAAVLGTHLIAPGSALAGGCGYCDDDYDGLTNSEELSYGTDLSNPDTDFDGASDLDEIVFFYTNPLVADQRPAGGGVQNNPGYDYDGDGLGAYDEQTYGTNVENADSDIDGLNDGDEVFYYGTSPISADSDGDSYGDGYELSMGYDPLNRFSVPPAPNGKG